MPTPDSVTLPASRTTWAFDLGKGSIGEAVRRGIKEFLHTESLLIPADLARRGPATAAGTPASRYRALKTREAHRAREETLQRICADAGIEVLAAKRVARDPISGKWRVVKEADPRLTREFPAPGDETCYTSCLLRIKLLRGDALESWQVFKALHSAIQRRGYDPDIPWKRQHAKKRHDEEDEGVTQQRAGAYRETLAVMAPGQADFHFPCYLDAWRLGLWSPERPAELRLRIDHTAEPARNRGDEGAIVAPRDLVQAELRRLLENAARLFPKLARRTDEILFGPGAKPYASYFPDLRRKHGIRQGGANDWQGVLGQKVPRFDNRILAKCALIPRFHVCSAAPVERDGTIVPDSLLPSEVTFLLKLKNMRMQSAAGDVRGLRAEEIRAIFNDPKRPAEKLSFTEKQWTNRCVALGLRPLAGHEKIDAPRDTGRSRFSRPALRILKDLILSGRTPLEQHAVELEKLAGNTDQKRGLTSDDISFLRRMGNTWDGLYVPDQQFDALLALADSKGRDAAVRALLGSCNDPIVRHRLDTFWKRVQFLEQKFGRPDEVVLEFVRDDFLGDKAKRELQKFQRQRENDRKRARESAQQQGATSRAAATKWELLEAQGFICLYTGESLPQTALEDLQIEHIVPRGKGGPDAMVNYVVTTHATNDAKANRTPYEWFESKQFAGWDAYLKRVDARATHLRNKKVRLLTVPDAAELVQRYTTLAETAWIARLAQTLVALHFGWPIRSQPGERCITIVNGGLTARVRRKYRLNSLLNPPPADCPDLAAWEERCEKNRDDDRHHALDAMVISYVPGWARDPSKEGFFSLPDGVTRETFARAVASVEPRNQFLSKAALEATTFGEREIGNHRYAVSRSLLRELATKIVSGKRVLKSLKDIETHRVVDPVIRGAVEGFLKETSNLSLNRWDEWCENYRRNGPSGPRVKKVLLTVSKPDELREYADLSKDKTGQLRRGKQHRGYFVVRTPAPTRRDPDRHTISVHPVYAHQDPYQIKALLAADKARNIVGFFQSGCSVQIAKPIEHPKTPLTPGIFRLNSIWEQGTAVVTDATSKVSAPIGLGRFIEAGLQRVD